MKMKKLLATALILLMSMMACVPAFAEGWPNTITETIDCTVFTKDETDECWDWDHTTKTLKIKKDLLIEITQKKGNDNYGIILPGGATLDITNGKRLLVAIVSDGKNYGIGDCVYSTGAITINGTLEAGRQGGDIFAVAAPKVTLGKDAQVYANSCVGGVVTSELVVNGDNAILANYWCIVQFNGEVKITGSGTLTLDCGATPINCKSYTVDSGVTLNINLSPVSKGRITYTIPDSLKDGIKYDDTKGELTVSTGTMSSDAWAAAIREALKASPSGEISSIGFDINVTPPDGATKMMYSKEKNITDEEFNKKVLDPNSAWGTPSEVAVDLATVAKDSNGDYTVTPKQDDECIYIAWKDDRGNVLGVEKLEIKRDAANPIKVTKEQVAKPAEKPSSGGSGSSVWYRGGNSLGASIPSDPTEVLIDGVSVPFTVDGNTITIPSLTDGRHNVQVIWRGGSYSFNITASGTVKSVVALPKTGDSSMGPYVGLCMLVFVGMLAGGAVLNRKKAK